jgi:hypothetical protein
MRLTVGSLRVAAAGLQLPDFSSLRWRSLHLQDEALPSSMRVNRFGTITLLQIRRNKAQDFPVGAGK